MEGQRKCLPLGRVSCRIGKAHLGDQSKYRMLPTFYRPKLLSVALQSYLEEDDQTHRQNKRSRGQRPPCATPEQNFVEQCKAEARLGITVRNRTPEKMEQRRVRQIRYRQQKKQRKKNPELGESEV